MGCGSSNSGGGSNTEKKAAGGKSEQYTVVFVLGGPGSGKGTQCARIVSKFGFVHLSAGDLLREERKNPESKNGKLIEDFIKEGKIVPVEITVALVLAAMDASAAKGKTKFLVDGFPRNLENLEGWNKVVGGKANVAFVLFFDCPEDVLEKRLLGRNEGRADDNIETIKKRFATFKSESMAVVKVLGKEGKVRNISSVPPPDEVFAEVEKAINSIKC